MIPQYFINNYHFSENINLIEDNTPNLVMFQKVSIARVVNESCSKEITHYLVHKYSIKLSYTSFIL